MSNKADMWAGNIQPVQSSNAENRAFETARLIDSRPTIISVIRSGRVHHYERVFVDVPASASGGSGEVVNIPSHSLLVVGMKGHPSIPDTDIRMADRWFYNGRMYEATDVVSLTIPGRFEVTGEVHDASKVGSR